MGFTPTRFTLTNEKTTILCTNVALLLGQLNFTDLQKFNSYSLLSNFCIKAKIILNKTFVDFFPF